MKSELEIKQEMCEIGRRVYNRGMVAANDGNFSVKLSEDEYLCTPCLLYTSSEKRRPYHHKRSGISYDNTGVDTAAE